MSKILGAIPKKRFVLSVDGGGIKGVVPAVILKKLEEEVGRPISSMFDVMAGTSTGGIVVAGLALRGRHGKPMYTASKIVDFYKDEGHNIFKSHGDGKPTIWNKLKKLVDKAVGTIFNIFGSQYNAGPLEDALGIYFADYTLNDVLTQVLFPSYNATGGSAVIFNNDVEMHRTLLLKDVLRATTAAPLYFKAKTLSIPLAKMNNHLFIDGGIFANNPVVVAYCACRKKYPEDDIYILSLGTGFQGDTVTDENMGFIGWLKHFLSTIMNANTFNANMEMNDILGNKCFRIQPDIKHGSIDLDDARPENILNLKKDAEQAIKDYHRQITAFSELLKSEKA